MFDLDTKYYQPNGDLIEKKPKTKEQLDEIEFKNQVYEKLFTRIDHELE